jgi:hypothetical protein
MIKNFVNNGGGGQSKILIPSEESITKPDIAPGNSIDKFRPNYLK